MSVFACGCGSKSKSRKNRMLMDSDLCLYKQKFRFTENELLEFRQRFNSLANTRDLIDRALFMESMGVLGLDSGAFLAERIFQVIDKDKDGYIKLEEYLGYFDVLIYGSEEEKQELTFRMIDVENKGWFGPDEFSDMIVSMLQTWNNITGHNYNIHQNKRLQNFLNTVFKKLDITREYKVTVATFKEAVTREPELLEIFDYFNEGIIDTVQPVSELELQNQELIQELEELHTKISHLKSLLKGKSGVMIPLDESLGGMQKEKSPRTSQIPRGSVFQVHKPEENKVATPMAIQPIEAKHSMLQTLDTKIRRTAIFEYLKEGSGAASGDDVSPTKLLRPRSAILKPESDNGKLLSFKTDDFNETKKMQEFDIDINKHSFSAGKNSSKRNDKRRTLDRLDSSYNDKKIPVLIKKPSKKGRNTDVPNQGQDGKDGEDVVESLDKYLVGIPAFAEADEIFEDNTPRLRLSGETFVGIMLQSQRPESRKDDITFKRVERTEQNDVEVGEFVIGENEEEEEKRFEGNISSKRKPEGVMVEPKDLESELVDLSKSKGGVTRGPSKNQSPIKLDDIKLSNSIVLKKEENHAGDRYRWSSRDSYPSPKLMGYHDNVDMSIQLKHDEDKMQVITQQIEMLAAETRKMIDQIHKKRRLAHKPSKEDDKKMEFMKEMTSHNIHKTGKVKTKKGNFVSFGHQNWNLVLNMMLGIQMAVKSAMERPETLTLKDFKVKYIFELIPKRTSEMKDAFKICTFFDYAPSIFLEIRRLFGIKNDDYLKSIGPESMLNGLIKGNLSTLAELTSSGKSGSFFYYSADGKYTLKTISREEFHFLRKILNNYYNHIMNNTNTLMIKFFGLHKVRFMKGPQRKAKLYIIIMANVFHTYREIHVRYDLKGSTQGRITKDQDPTIARKDLNIIQEKEKIILTKEFAETFTSILEKDAHFFEENNIIDYSLLIGIHYLEHDEIGLKRDSVQRKPAIEFKSQSKEGILSGDGTKIYFLGIIDILTQFNARKKAEYMVKRIAYGKGISAIPPPKYAQRFLNFIKGLVEVAPK